MGCMDGSNNDDTNSTCVLHIHKEVWYRQDGWVSIPAADNQQEDDNMPADGKMADDLPEDGKPVGV
jgi:hypothetical protein